MVLETGIAEFTDVDDLDGEALTAHIRCHLDAADVLPRLRGEHGEGGCPDVLDEIPALSGGFALDLDGHRIASPGCCSDLGVLGDWREAAEHRAATAAMLWTGHPWLLVAAEGDDRLALSGPTERNHGPAEHLLTVPRAALRSAVEAAETERARFARQVTAVCAGLAGEPLAAPLAGVLLAD
ncbi:hypothetical protein AB0J52_26055 [Spirillospora sp. NPDC049652]